ncbi:MAG TPA: FimV/HubP family polar landmark protein, partial [Gallionella sp.]|nr:FimV/HubP family polar landmark protein [Gallionella sp.]
DLAKAYHEMGDASGAREILDEVMREGDAEQRESAQALFAQLG